MASILLGLNVLKDCNHRSNLHGVIISDPFKINMRLREIYVCHDRMRKTGETAGNDAELWCFLWSAPE